MTIKRVAVAGLAAALVLLLVAVVRERPADGQAIPEVVRAKAIELVDSNGRVRAQINVSGDEVIFRLRDAKGTIRAKLGADASGSGLLLNDETTRPGVHLLATRTRTSLALQKGAKRRVLRP